MLSQRAMSGKERVGTLSSLTGQKRLNPSPFDRPFLRQTFNRDLGVKFQLSNFSLTL